MNEPITTIPDTLNAVWLKRFFKQILGIPVRVNGGNNDRWVQIWIQSDRGCRELKYNHRFPDELGRRCMGIVYKGHTTLSQQTWGGNIGAYSIALHKDELRELLDGLLRNPVDAVAMP